MRTITIFNPLKFSFRGVFLVGILCISAAVFAGTTASPHSNIEIPLFQGAYQIQKSVDPISGLAAVGYSVRLKPPATEVIEFYDSFFNGNGWISSFEICQRHWDMAPQQSGDIKPLERQMYASWEHPDFDLRFVLWLKYDSTAKYGADEVTVDGRLQSKTGG